MITKVKTMLWVCAAVLVCAAVRTVGRAATGDEAAGPLNIGSRLELFVDDYLIEKATGVSLLLHEPQRAGKVLDFDKPWEGSPNADEPQAGSASAYVTVFKDGDLYRMYYRGMPNKSRNASVVTCYAESKDGIHWVKPSLGLCDYKGSQDNNIVWTGPGTHNFAPFLDTNPQAPADRRYKAVAGGMGKARALHSMVSPDGLHWKFLQDGLIKKTDLTQKGFDSQNLAFWDAERQCYQAYFRVWVSGVRLIAHSTSPDFVHWSDAELIQGAPAETHLYTNATTPYFRAPHILLAFPARFMGQRKAVSDYPVPGVSDGLFMTSRDGLHFHSFEEAFLRPGRDRSNWTQRSNYIAWGVVPTAADEISIYFTQQYEHPTAHVARGVLRTDGFVSAHASAQTGELITKPLLFDGKLLVINYATSAAGSIRVELQTPDGKPVAGRSLSEEIYGDEIERVATWKSDGDLSAWAGRPVRLRFVMKDADLYSLCFVSKPPAPR